MAYLNGQEIPFGVNAVITEGGTNEDAVLYTEEQTLTDEQKARARANIGIDEMEKNVQASFSAVDDDIEAVRREVATLNAGGLQLKDEVIKGQVDAWLGEHPEATTTVQDKSIEVSKFTDGLSRKIIGNKVYLSDYLDGDGVLHSISAKDPAVTVEQVRALDSGATLSNSYDWYIIQTLINEVPDNTTLVFDGTYMIDRPITIKRGHINLMSLEDDYNARSLLRFTLTDKDTDFITIGLVGTSQIQRINISGIRFRGSINYDTGGHSGNGIVINNSNGSDKSDCLCVNFDNCDFEHFKDGVYVGGGYYVSSHIRECYFGYNIENGFYGKHTGAIQLNELIFDNIGSACNGLIVDTVNKKLVYKTDGESAIVNISGCGITLRNVGGMISTYGIIINDGTTVGMNLSGMYLEANTVADVFIKGTNVTNLCILDAFSDMKEKVISTDKSILDKAVIPLLTDKIVNSGVFKQDLSVQRPVFHKQRELINNRHAVHLGKTDGAGVCDFSADLCHKCILLLTTALQLCRVRRT